MSGGTNELKGRRLMGNKNNCNAHKKAYVVSHHYGDPFVLVDRKADVFHSLREAKMRFVEVSSIADEAWLNECVASNPYALFNVLFHANNRRTHELD